MIRNKLWILACLFGGLSNVPCAAQWGDLQGHIVFKGKLPERKPLNFANNKDANVCKMDKDPNEENWIVHPTSKGVKNVFVWIRPNGLAKGAAFPVAQIHPSLLKPAKDTVDIDQPCCRFIPHVLAAREGQKLVIKNSASIAHNANFASTNNGNFNPILASGGQFALPKPLVVEPSVISLSCNLHPWMKAHIRIFDHPYFAITDDDGKFEIRNAPVGKLDIWYWHPTNGWLGGRAGRDGYPIVIKAGNNILEKKEMELNP